MKKSKNRRYDSLFCEPVLPYPLVPFGNCEEYQLPLESKASFFAENSHFGNRLCMTDTVFDLHSQKFFTLSDYKVIREREINYIVSPYYLEGGGTVIDFMPEQFGHDYMKMMSSGKSKKERTESPRRGTD